MNSKLKGFAATALIVLIPVGLASIFGKQFFPLCLLGAGIALTFPLLMPWPKAFIGSIWGFITLAILVTLNYAYLDIARQAGSVGDDGGGHEAVAKAMYASYFFAALITASLRALGVMAYRYFQKIMKERANANHIDESAD